MAVFDTFVDEIQRAERRQKLIRAALVLGVIGFILYKMNSSTTDNTTVERGLLGKNGAGQHKPMPGQGGSGVKKPMPGQGGSGGQKKFGQGGSGVLRPPGSLPRGPANPNNPRCTIPRRDCVDGVACGYLSAADDAAWGCCPTRYRASHWGKYYCAQIDLPEGEKCWLDKNCASGLVCKGNLQGLQRGTCLPK